MADHDQDDECAICGGPLASDGVCADDDCGDDEDPPAIAVDLMAALKETLDQAKKRRLAWADRLMADLTPNQRYWLAQAAMGCLVYDTESGDSYRYDEWDWNQRIVDPDFHSLIRLGLIKHDAGVGRCSWDSAEHPRTKKES